MVACPGGAVVKAGEPAWYYVTDSDLDRWFGTWNVTRMAMELFNGRAYNLAALAAANPDTPPVRSWSDFILSITGTSTVARVNGVTAYGDELVAYHVFQEHCECSPYPPGTVTTTLVEVNAPYNPGNTGTYADAVTVPIRAGCSLIEITLVNNGDRNTAYRYRLNPFVSGAYLLSSATLASGGTNARTYTTTSSGPLTDWASFTIELGGNTGFVGTVAVWVRQTYQLTASATPVPSSPSVTMTGAQTLPSLAGATTDEIAQAIFRLQTTVDTYGAVLEVLQERLEPFGYRAGPTHAGLSGTGSFALGLCVALRITLTTVPGTKGKIEGTPDDFFDVGGVHVGDASGWFRYVRIEHTPQLVKDIPAYATVLGYRFPPGVVATIDELVI